MRLIVSTLVLLHLSGCVASYQHLSDPRIDNDGYDLICAGAEKNIGSLRVRGDLCSNVAPNGGEFVHTAIEYRFNSGD